MDLFTRSLRGLTLQCLGRWEKGCGRPPPRCREGVRGSPPQDRRPQGAKERYRAGGSCPGSPPAPGCQSCGALSDAVSIQPYLYTLPPSN